MPRTSRTSSIWSAAALRLILVLTPAAVAAAAPALEPVAAASIAEGRAIVAAMKESPRGPYKYLRWFCNDGEVLLPRPFACVDHGGGKQYAVYSDARDRLVELGWSTGTVFVVETFDSVFDAGRRNQRLRELSLERYLTDVDDGWVLRRAQYYRGRVQVEDEEEAGRKILTGLLSRPSWVRDNFLLARESVRVIPHTHGGDRTRKVRRVAADISERDPSFDSLRVRIHAAPSAADARAVRRWLGGARDRGAAPQLLADAEELAREIDRIFGGEGRADRLTAQATRMRDPEARKLFLDLASGLSAQAASERLRRLALVLRYVRERVEASGDGAANLLLLDLSVDAESELLGTTYELHGTSSSRGDRLAIIGDLLEASYGAGFLSARERDELRRRSTALLTLSSASATDYLAAIRALERAGAWGLGAVRHAFAEAIVRYVALEPRAAQFADDQVRGSPLLPLIQAISVLGRDAEQAVGITHRIAGEVRGGAAGLNPGAAIGRLRFVSDQELDASAHGGTGLALSATDIVVLPRTVSDLSLVAGILTLEEGNLLSHVQMLARNLGIPNASLDPALRATLRALDGQDIVFAVATSGAVLLEPMSGIPAEVASWMRRPESDPSADKVDAPAPDLAARDLIPLAGLHRGLSGRVVGPKAANLGELARNFPGRVAPAIAIPFGVFAERAAEPKARLDRAFAAHRAGGIDDAQLAAEIEAVRLLVRELELGDDLRATLRSALTAMFGAGDSFGVFVRSDTNVEDLPGFTGAGLNETVPNVFGFDRQARAIAQVWSSPFTRRAVAWRGRILTRPEEVYPSVLIMKSVPSEKSGVLVTVDLAANGAGITASTAWGVGGAVDGETAETLVLRPEGVVDVIAEAKTPYRRSLAAGGGVEWLPAASGAVLTTAEQEQLRALAVEAQARLTPELGADGKPLPWDIEFGFVAGELTLFQVRPLVARGAVAADRVVAALIPPLPPATKGIPLDQPPAVVAPPPPAPASPGVPGAPEMAP